MKLILVGMVILSLVGFATLINCNAEELRYLTVDEVKIHDRKIPEHKAEHEKPSVKRVVNYIKSKNKKIDMDIARTLARSIVKESQRNNIPIEVILGLIAVESRFNPDAVGSAGEVSFWQVMPDMHHKTISHLRDNNMIQTNNLFDPTTNSVVGARILRDCIKKYGTIELGLGCYNGSQRDKKMTYARKVLSAAPNQI